MRKVIQNIVFVAVKWLDIHLRVKRMIRSVFESAAVVHPEMQSPKSRAIYGVDVMLDSHFQPKLLEVCDSTFLPMLPLYNQLFENQNTSDTIKWCGKNLMCTMHKVFVFQLRSVWQREPKPSARLHFADNVAQNKCLFALVSYSITFYILSYDNLILVVVTKSNRASYVPINWGRLHESFDFHLALSRLHVLLWWLKYEKCPSSYPNWYNCISASVGDLLSRLY